MITEKVNQNGGFDKLDKVIFQTREDFLKDLNLTPVAAQHNVCFAAQRPPVAVHSLLSESPHEACKEHLKKCFELEYKSSSGKLPIKLRVEDTAEEQLSPKLRAGGARVLVWSGVGIGSRILLELEHSPAQLKHSRWPLVTIICLKYGASRLAESIQKMGAPATMSVSMDLASPSGLMFVSGRSESADVLAVMLTISR